jgi:hypothetical protein
MSLGIFVAVPFFCLNLGAVTMKVILLALVFGVMLTSTLGFSAVEAVKAKQVERLIQIDKALQ